MASKAGTSMMCKACWCMLQVVSWWGPTWREGSHDTQGVNTDKVLGLVLAEAAQQQQLKVAFHMEPYEGTCTLRVLRRGHSRRRHLLVLTALCAVWWAVWVAIDTR
jgi:hypothetical protein